MHDPKRPEEGQRFEKEVQQKMEELSFRPSETVWANVAQAIQEKKRRRAPFFWLFFLPALLLVGAGTYFIGFHTHAPAAVAAISPLPVSVASPAAVPDAVIPGSALLSTEPSKPSVPATGSSTSSVSSRVSSDPSPAAPATLNSAAPNSVTPNAATINSTASHSVPAVSNTFPQSASTGDNTLNSTTHNNTTRNGAALHNAHLNRTPVNKTVPARTVSSGIDAKGTTANEIAANGKASAQSSTIHFTRMNKPAGPTGNSSALLSPDAVTINQRAKIDLHPIDGKKVPNVSVANVAVANVTAPNLPAAPVAKSPARSKIRLSPPHPWQTGFTGGVGLSSLNQSLFRRSAVNLNESRSFAAPVTGVPHTYLSKVQPDLSFWAGIFLQKDLLQHVSVSFGLNLHYYSTLVYTGDKVAISNPGASNYSYVAALSPAAFVTPAATTPTYPYYLAGDKQAFVNRYYFLEIPASIQWQIRHVRKMPLFWEVGGSLSYLMSSNALYYNTKAGVYYKDGDVTNKTQLSLSTALLIGIPFKGFNLQAGPQLQYGLTNLLDTETAGGQHLLYGGVKLVIAPHKAHRADHQ